MIVRQLKIGNIYEDDVNLDVSSSEKLRKINYATILWRHLAVYSRGEIQEKHYRDRMIASYLLQAYSCHTVQRRYASSQQMHTPELISFPTKRPPFMRREQGEGGLKLLLAFFLLRQLEMMEREEMESRVEMLWVGLELRKRENEKEREYLYLYSSYTSI